MWLLARWAGLTDESGEIPLDIAPLFETVPDLEAAPRVLESLFAKVLESLFAKELYRRHLRERGNRQVVMIGYSDSNKDSGFAAARWALQKGQEQLVEVCNQAGVELLLFHGRGGTVSRGGGKTRDAVLAAPRGSVRSGRGRTTQSGRMIPPLQQTIYEYSGLKHAP